MPEIRILADQVANQIAAGEVVERPVAVLKELVENSIDAGASKIEIEFRNGGKSYLRVEDDGLGMTQDQALLSLERHATSKIRKASDLNQVGTFGFRGEALPSIASVSRFVLRTRSKKGSDGTEIFVNGGKLVHCKECGMPRGTRVEVSHLFNSVPGRRKFLKTEVTEATHLVHMAKLYALSHPSLTFTLLESGRTLFRSPACEVAADRVREIFGTGLSESLVPFQAEDGDFVMHGLLGKPGQSRSTRKEMIFFVNRRPVDSKTLSYAVLEAFHTFVPKGRHPLAILFLEVDPASVDVNVHPSTASPSAKPVQEAIQNGVDDDKTKALPQIDPRALELYGIKETTQVSENLHEGSNSIKKPSDEKQAFGGDIEPSQTVARTRKEIINRKLVGNRQEPGAEWQFLDRSHGDLAIFSTPQGVVALHARAAYERIRFEQLEDSLRGTDACVSQSLLLAEPLELDGIDSTNLRESLPKLRKLGFLLEEFGRNFYRLEGCPHWLPPEDAANYLRDFLEVAREHGGDLRVESFIREALERQVNYSHETKASFSDAEMIKLASQLLGCRNPFVCPRGRPVYFEIPIRDFETRFKRKL
ncbi:MAG: DNA mismatch repair endonuclease MutL [Opitutae bacterium]|nr:DNA mismatch repair endonuclease MutL [Opitutae bacterium]